MPANSITANEAEQHVVVGPHQHDLSLFRLESKLLFPAPLKDAFAFFADARNLEILTPPWIQFRIDTPLPIKMHAGTVIDYRLRIRGLPLRWRTLISVWEPPHRFVDEQVRGPYRFWRHEHRFEQRNAGTLMIDTVDYRVPGGRLVNRWFVQPDVERIFGYRVEKLREVFGN